MTQKPTLFFSPSKNNIFDLTTDLGPREEKEEKCTEEKVSVGKRGYLYLSFHALPFDALELSHVSGYIVPAAPGRHHQNRFITFSTFT